MTACDAVTPVLGVWFELSRCPSAQETDAIQLATNSMLDAADEQISSGLARAGYSLFVVAACATLMQPSQRTSLVAYTDALGISLAFAEPAPAVLLPLPLLRNLFVSQPAESAPQPPAPRCLALELASTSGAAGWNDRGAQLLSPSQVAALQPTVRE